jgi:deoxycytidylate deaminase
VTDFEGEIKYHLNHLKEMSTCKDKQVAAVAVKHGMIVAAAFNVRDPQCKGDCNHTCCPTHAEHELQAPAGSVVYLTLYPCEQCQRELYNREVLKVVVFNIKTKHDLGLIPIEVKP